VCVRHRAPLVITALGGPRAVVEAVHRYGGAVFADVNTPEFARKAVASGVDGLVLVCSGAGGHTGPMAAPAFVSAVREFFDGVIVVGGGLCDGASILAVQAMGADLGYMGTRFIATQESQAVAAYKQMVVDSGFADIICTNAITGAWANKLRPSLVAAGLDPDNLQARGRFDLSNQETDAKAWRDLWSAGHGVGQVRAIESATQVIDRLKREYLAARQRLDGDRWSVRLQSSTSS
jgi:nitronate monooxygenase